jgi:CubicO group peptidase (beta-lactamase class C family)
MSLLHDAMAARVAAGELPGLVTAIFHDGSVGYDEIGAVSFAPGARPMTRDALFRIGSLTKPILAAVTLMLVEDGTLSLGEPIDKWLPELAGRRVLKRVDGPIEETAPAQRPITFDDLLTFRMGCGVVTEPVFNPPYPVVQAADALRLTLAQPDPRTPHPPDEWLARFATLPLLSQPGERWMYNAGSLVLGVLVARASRMPLADLLRERLFGPLGMAETGFHTDSSNVDRIPVYYMTDFATGKVTPQPGSPPGEWASPPVFPSGAGGLLSTVDDFLRFARMLLAGGEDLLSAESVALMTRNHLTPRQMATSGMILGGLGWGYGVAVWPDGRYGWDGGYGTVWFSDPARNLIGPAMTQCSDFLFNGGRDQFHELAIATTIPGA